MCGDHRHGGGAYDAAVVPGDERVASWAARGEYHRVLGHRVFVVDRSPEDADEGARPPVLVLHGFPTSSHDWHPVLDRFARRHRVVVPDLLGFGLSDKPDQRYSLFEQADLVEAVAGDLGLDEVALVTHDMGDSVGGELLARSLDGTLSFDVTRRVLTNGSVYIDMAHLTDGQQLLLALPDERLAEGLGRDALVEALRGTFAPDAPVPDDDVQVGAELILRDGGDRLLPRTIRYVEERREHEGRWDRRDRAAPVSADDRVGRSRPDRRLADGRTCARGATGRDARKAARHRPLPDARIARRAHRRAGPRAGGYFVNSASADLKSITTPWGSSGSTLAGRLEPG